MVRHENRLYQVEGQSRRYAPAKSRVTVCEWEDGTKEIYYRGRRLIWHEIEERVAKQVVAAKRRRVFTPPAVGMPDHPWRKSYQDMKPLGAPLAGEGVGRISAASTSTSPQALGQGLAGLRYGCGRGNPNGLGENEQKGHF